MLLLKWSVSCTFCVVQSIVWNTFWSQHENHYRVHLGAETTVLERLFKYDIFAILQFQIFFKTESAAHFLLTCYSLKKFITVVIRTWKCYVVHKAQLYSSMNSSRYESFRKINVILNRLLHTLYWFRTTRMLRIV